MGNIPFPNLKALSFGLKALVITHTLGLVTFYTVKGVDPPWFVVVAYGGALAAAGIEQVADYLNKRGGAVDDEEAGPEFEGSVSGQYLPEATVSGASTDKGPTFRMPRNGK